MALPAPAAILLWRQRESDYGKASLAPDHNNEIARANTHYPVEARDDHLCNAFEARTASFEDQIAAVKARMTSSACRCSLWGGLKTRQRSREN
jgi:hypothetical protein